MSDWESHKPVLLVCRSLSEIHLLQRFQPQPGCRYILASDDLRLHLEVKKYPWVAEVCYLEQMESYFTVAGDVIKYLALINQWLTSLGNDPRGIPRELLFWIRHCEGGKTTQRLQDLLLLIRSYQYLLDTYNISAVIILSHPAAGWEDDVFVKVGQQQGIKVRVLGRFSFSFFKAKLFAGIKLLAREPYYIFHILHGKLWGRLRSDQPAISDNEIALQMCLPHAKFVEEHVLVMKALKELGYDPVALLWRASPAAAKFQQEGLGVEQLETYVPMASMGAAPYRVWQTWRQARRRRGEFLAHPGLYYHRLALGPLLWPSVAAFFWEELAQRYRLWQAARRYFRRHAPRAIRLWGGGILAEGSIVAKSFPGQLRPRLFLWVGAAVEDPYYEPPAQALFLAAGDNQKKYLEKLGVPPRRIVTVGSSRFDHLGAFRGRYSPAQSRAHLNLPQDFHYYILFDSNADARGHLTVQEQSQVINALGNFAREHPSVAVMIKPHPVHRPGWLEALLDYMALPNVFLLDKDMVPYHALNASDVFITKLSTMALEAMLFKKPVISILLDGEERFRIFGDAAARVNSLEALNDLLTMLINEDGGRAAWLANQLKNQENYCQDYFGTNVSESAKIGAAALDRFLTDTGPPRGVADKQQASGNTWDTASA